MLSQWKLFDNLRRSLVPVALTLLLLLGWTVLSPAWFWTRDRRRNPSLAPFVIASLSDLVDKPPEVPLGQHLAAVGAPHGGTSCRRRSRSPFCRMKRSSVSTRSCAPSADASSPAGACWNGIRRMTRIARWSTATARICSPPIARWRLLPLSPRLRGLACLSFSRAYWALPDRSCCYGQRRPRSLGG